MLKNKKITIVLLACIVSGITSCKKYLDVNKNPNIAQTATVQTMLPAAQLYVGAALGVDLQIDGSFWAQHWTQSPSASQYHNLDVYSIGQDGFSFPWGNLYSAAENFYQVGKLADSFKLRQYQAIAVVMQAYTFQLITDGWGDVPFRQALKGQYSDGHIVNPSYDSQMVVYNGILSYIDSANKLINLHDKTGPTTDDLIYGGAMDKWQKFANTLKLRALLRMSAINPAKAQAGIAALYATPATSTFLGEGDDAVIKYGSNSSNKNPLYGEIVGLGYVQNLVASSSCVDSMNNNDDYRAYAVYEPISTGAVVGLTQGIVGNNIVSGSYSIPSSYVGGNANNANSTNAPVNFLTGYESYFLQAEAVARGWAGGNDSALFYHGVLASFRYLSAALTAQAGVDGDASDYIYVHGDTTNLIAPGYWAVYPTTGSVTARVRHIITQKWFSMCGNQGFEAWCELRRTGYPDFLPYPVSASVKQFPKRFLYPTSESNVNASFPGLQPLTSKMWWDLY